MLQCGNSKHGNGGNGWCTDHASISFFHACYFHAAASNVKTLHVGNSEDLSSWLITYAPTVSFSILVGGGMSATLGTTIPMAAIVTVEALFWLFCKLQHYSMVVPRVWSPHSCQPLRLSTFFFMVFAHEYCCSRIKSMYLHMKHRKNLFVIAIPFRQKMLRAGVTDGVRLVGCSFALGWQGLAFRC